MKKIQILNRFDNSVLFEGEFESLKDVVASAVANRADLSSAYLRSADLSGADLSGAYLSGADLSGANLSSANLSSANLSSADLSSANLSGADLSYANLSSATLENTIMPGFTDKQPTSLIEAAQRTKEWLLDGHWVKGKWIDTPDGAYAGSCLACLHGAAVYVGGEFGPELSKKMCAMGYDVEWNDNANRSIEEIGEALDKFMEGQV